MTRPRRQTPRRRRLSTRLTLLFFVITAAALGAIYLLVVPQLESTLAERRLRDLESVAVGSRPSLESLVGDRSIAAPEVDRRTGLIADAAGARVTILGIQRSLARGGGPSRFYLISDSGQDAAPPIDTGLATLASERRGPVQGRTGDPAQSAVVALPLRAGGRTNWVTLVSRPLDEVAETVSFVRTRLLLATGFALLLSVVGGAMVSQAVGRRVERLERAALEVAAGQAVEPLPVESHDELGQLTESFNAMQEQLRQVDAARKEFVATASHELRTPIFSLGGFVELLRDEDLDEETRTEFIELMGEQTDRLQKLAVDLLDLSRLDAGAVELEREAVDLGELARAVLAEFRPAVARHCAEVETRLPARVQALCDRERVAQIMRILVDNALRHTPEGTRVTVATERQNGSVAFSVADDGPGLADDRQAFERFSTGDAQRGAGLGLAIARELAERMDGSVDAAPSRGGARLVLRLPVQPGRTG